MLVIIGALVPFEVQGSVIPLVLSEVLAPEALTVDLLDTSVSSEGQCKFIIEDTVVSFGF